MSETSPTRWGLLALVNGVVAAYMIYDVATASETPRDLVVTMQYVVIAGCLVGFVVALVKYFSQP